MPCTSPPIDDDDDDQKLSTRREVLSASPPFDDDDDDRKLPKRQEVLCASPPFGDYDDDRKLPTRREVPCASPLVDEDCDDPQPPKTGTNQIKSVNPPDVGFLCVSQKVHTEDTTDGLAVVLKNGPRHINQIKSVKPPGVGFLCVSQKVHTEDTTDGLALAVGHKNGPRHIPSANSSSSNRCKLASVIPAFKTSHGSNMSRKNKAKKSYSKRRKQDACLNPIIPTFSHQAFRDLVNDDFTFVDGGDISVPRIHPPASTLKPIRVLSIRDNHLQVIRSHIQM